MAVSGEQAVSSYNYYHYRWRVMAWHGMAMICTRSITTVPNALRRLLALTTGCNCYLLQLTLASKPDANTLSLTQASNT